MIFKDQVRKWFNEAVIMSTGFPDELKHTLRRGHPKIDQFIDSMTWHLNEAVKINLGRKKLISQKTLQDTVYDFTQIFMQGLENEANRRKESDIAKRAREAKQDEIKEFDSVLEGKPIGEFAEAGVISDEAEDIKREKILEQRDKRVKAQATVGSAQ